MIIKSIADSIKLWDGKDESGNIVPSGLYFNRIETSSGQVQSKRMIFFNKF